MGDALTVPLVRVADPNDVPEVVRVTNLAYVVESFFIEGDRTDEAEARALMAQPQSTFLVIDDPALAGCRYLDFDMINLRSELPAFYARFGFVEVGTAEMGDRHKLKLECHRITMSKPLRRENAAERP
jgi:hypothetical protein